METKVLLYYILYYNIYMALETSNTLPSWSVYEFMCRHGRGKLTIDYIMVVNV